ncbi:TorD/DmsD family molecular chaperone [Sulfurimonas paralvinellae]|uniref:Molecular chaperone TorD family protein n=1 Tax=Sulfurimonas paralvinellae TaxID=317658 RepID=A0A7M1B9Q0_9BACT|nr:molecular chaperone TorD family protein [Sulfurimonas paralvinellae]QOP46186.1 molecular chaperone TorD family protein [Sulfurimonas paralvinellae]
MNNDLKQQQNARINIYALISRLMIGEVDEGLLKSIEDDQNMLSFFPTYATWKKREEYDRKELIERYLNVDFTNLFLLHLIPYESFYTREDQMMETGGENPVQAIFNAFEFKVELDKARVMAADHIGIELEFMYELCRAELKALEDDDMELAKQLSQLQYGFMKDHILEWAPMYLLNVKNEAGTAFYYDLADLALEFIMSDFEYLTALKENEYNYNA